MILNDIIVDSSFILHILTLCITVDDSSVDIIGYWYWYSVDYISVFIRLIWDDN